VDALFRFLVKNETPFYLLLSLGGLFAFRNLYRAWVEWKQSVFGLEKEMAFQRVRSSGTIAILLVMMGLSVFCLVSFVAPFIPAMTFLQTATPDLFATPRTTLPPGATPAATLPQPPAGTLGCIPGKLIITSLQAGQTLQGAVELKGTVDLPNFGFFKYEYAPVGSQDWVAIAAGRDPLRDASLGVWNTSTITPGDYTLRVVVTDNTGTALPPCEIPVRIAAPDAP